MHGENTGRMSRPLTHTAVPQQVSCTGSGWRQKLSCCLWLAAFPWVHLSLLPDRALEAAWGPLYIAGLWALGCLGWALRPTTGGTAGRLALVGAGLSLVLTGWVAWGKAAP